MNSIRTEFKENLSVVKKHIKMLNDIQRGGFTNIAAADARLMKSSVYLQLYNLMESNVSKMLNYIHDTIDSENVVFADLTEEMQLILFNHLKGLINEKNIQHSFNVIINNHRTAKFGPFQKRNYKGYDLSGNIDYNVISNLFSCIGIKLRYNSKYGLLKTIKDNRNWLAHGNKTFIEIGQSTTPQALDDCVNSVNRAYLYMFRKVEDFCINKQYLRAVP